MEHLLGKNMEKVIKTLEKHSLDSVV